jgi:hypothetical protein
METALRLFVLAAICAACSGTEGHVVKGPVARAALGAHRLDPAAEHLTGQIVAEGATGYDGSMRELWIPPLETAPLVIVSEGGTDIFTHEEPVLPKLRTLLVREDPAGVEPVYATPLTTLTLELAALVADLRVGFYRGNGDGQVTAAELLDAIEVAEAMVREAFGLGLLDDANLFTSPPLILPTTETQEEQDAAIAHRMAVEAFAALLLELLDATSDPGGELTPEVVLVALARDLMDGELDAAAFGEPIEALPDAVILEQILSLDPGELFVPNSDIRISELAFRLGVESLITAPGLRVEWRRLRVPPLDPVVLLIDRDGDGVADPRDAFPGDSADWADADADGVGDNSDAYPQNAACWAEGDGNGEDCLVNVLAHASPRQLVAGDDGIVYILLAAEKRILRFDPDAGHFLPAIHLRGQAAPRSIAYSPNHDRLYVAYQGTAITYVDPSRSLDEVAFASTREPIYGLAAVGNFLLAQDNSGAWESHYLFDRDGRQTDWEEWNHYSRVYAWNEVNDRVYFFRDTTSPNDLMWEKVDQNTGVITSEGETPYHGAFTIAPPITVSGDGRYVMLGSGDVYDANTLLIAGSIPPGQSHAVWPTGMGPITLSPLGADRTLLERRDAQRNVAEYRVYDGNAIGLIELGDRLVVVLETSTEWRFVEYVPSDDSDGDGVGNGLDAFPLDPAASQDTDRDGYPDVWNPGHDASDSTSGLVLDSYPQDSACFLPEHGDGTTCDIAARLPNYLANEITADRDGTIYLLSSSQSRVFRWSAVTGEHLNPLFVGSSGPRAEPAPTEMAWSPSHERLYLGYPNGGLTYVAPALGADERSFAATAEPVGGLASVGNFVLAQDNSGAWESHYIFDRNGQRTDWEEWNHYSRVYEWSDANQRVYFFRDTSSPNDLMWEEVDQATGTIIAEGETPYHGSYSILPPIRVSPDGSRVLLGSGDLYDGLSLRILDSLPVHLVDAAWLADGSLVTIRESGDGRTLLEQWSADLTLYNVQYYRGAPLRVVATAGAIVVITQDGTGPAFAYYVPTDDGDGDGVVNSEDAFPLDPAASLDSDGDGYPDAWNPGKGPGDSTEGLTLDAFPFDSACQLPEHALPGQSGVCDIAHGIPSYEPARIEMDEDGIIYLLSPEQDRIFRWSIDAAYHLNPLFVGDDPRHLAYSPRHERLYVGYASGAITQLDARDPAAGERPFATTAEPIGGLASVGDFVLAQDNSGAWESHYIFDRDGHRTDWQEWNHYSRVYEWSDANERVYFFRDTSSPNDLMWEEVDQATGTITAEGETPYHGKYAILPPIRVSPDGARVLLGSGDVYDARSLEYLDSLPDRLVDAAWLANGGLITIRAAADGRTVIEQWSAGLVLYDREAIDGRPIRVVVRGDDVVVITSRSEQPAFTNYILSDDGDEDGVVNAEDAFPVDPAASLDSDGDGYPDAWNPGHGPGDSTDRLILDAFPDDFACQVPEHGVGGVCDFEYVLPASYGDPFCGTDAPLPSGSHGSATLGATSDFVPLCDGWMLIGDTTDDRIAIHNVIENRRGANHPLGSAPGDLELDEQRKLLYIALPEQRSLGVLDLVAGDLEVLSVGIDIAALSLDSAGNLFVLGRSASSYSGQLYRLAAGAVAPQGPWPIAGRLMRVNAVTGEIVAADGSSSVRRYSFTPATGPVLLQTASAGNAGDLAISRDGRHVAVASGGGNGAGYTMFDFDASNLASVRGQWAVGAYPRGAAFDSTTDRVMASNYDSMLIFDVDTFQELKRYRPSYCSYGTLARVEFSRGDDIAFGRQVCGFDRDSTRFEWFVPGP